MGLTKRKARLGIAFGGGGARGIAHIGAIKAFEEYGIEFDYVAGTSAGSLVGAFYAAGYGFEQMLEICKKMDMKEMHRGKFGIMPSRTDGIESFLISQFGDIDIKDLKKPFAAVTVDLKTTKETCFFRGNLAKAVAGSCAVPGIFVPVEYDGMLLADGGLHNTMPADIVRKMGADVVISIDANKARGRGTESTRVLDVIGCSFGILMKSNVVKGYYNSDIVIKPETKRFKASKLDGLEDMIDEGYKAAIDEIQNIINLGYTSRFKRAKKIVGYDEEIIFVK